MIFHPDLFLTENTKSEYNKIMRCLLRGKKTDSVFLVTLSTDIAGLFDIVEYKSLFMSIGDVDQRKDLVVVGIGSDYDDAKNLCLHIISSFYAAGIKLDIREYFCERLDNCKKVS